VRQAKHRERAVLLQAAHGGLDFESIRLEGVGQFVDAENRLATPVAVQEDTDEVAAELLAVGRAASGGRHTRPDGRGVLGRGRRVWDSLDNSREVLLTPANRF
jgi:hypothetical protein